MYVDGNVVYTRTGMDFTDGNRVEAGLESYNMNLYVETHAYYNLKYKKGDGSFQDWAGKDGQANIEFPMCGEWHLPTSWWAGEHDSCV
jgi:hypothetical protein